MTLAQTSDALLTLVERSGLLAPDRLTTYRKLLAVSSATDAARALVRDRLLTPFQARQLLRGKSRGFFLTEKYKVLDQIGEGGMGQVLLCEHLLLHKLLAVKLLHLSGMNVPGAEERFLREARAAATLDHVNIVRVFDVDRAAGVPFMVMDYVDGKNLHALIAEHGPLSPLRAAEYTRQAAVGLQAAHQAGLVHRDIKPGNLLLDRGGVIKVLDLGLARFKVDAARNHNLTQRFDPGSVLGTLDFIAPEQADNSSAADIRADIYSLGHTLYYLLTGNLPFGDGSAAQKLMWHQSRQPEPLSSIRLDVPDELRSVMEKMIEKNPADRYQTPAELIEALRPLIVGPVPPPSPEHMPKLRPSAYLIGLSPSPTPEMLATAPEPSTPSLTLAETSRIERAENESGSDVLKAVTAGKTDASDPLVQLPTPVSSPVVPSASAPAQARRKRWPLVAGLVTLVAIAAGIGIWQFSGPRDKTTQSGTPNPANPNPQTPSAPNPIPPTPSGLVLIGEGSSFVDPMMQRWAELYKQKTGVTIQYTKSGSSAGVREFMSKRVMFGGTDAYLTEAQLLVAKGEGGPVLHIPLVMGAVVATYNLPTVDKPLQFKGGVLADIYLGKITRWNHPAIANNNPGVKLPDLEIKVVHRKEGSGTTFIWTDYLCKVSGEWKAGPNRDNSVKWPIGRPAEGNAGVAREVKANVGAIGYVEPSYALDENLPVALVQNRENRFIAPSPESVTAAATGKLKELVNEKEAEGIPADLRFTLTNAPGKDSYPICGTTWAVVFQNQKGESGEELKKFLRWVVHDGQAYVAEMKYAPLPAELIPRVDALLDKIIIGR
ncbi:MAG: phosphate ABC transporter substrate-binding protein PstS [Planctomycetia bacterium]|nr:phosphate ABC transporter substrate-binding protein PstS [Planctomycetia bacterium]